MSPIAVWSMSRTGAGRHMPSDVLCERGIGTQGHTSGVDTAQAPPCRAVASSTHAKGYRERDGHEDG